MKWISAVARKSALTTRLGASAFLAAVIVGFCAGSASALPAKFGTLGEGAGQISEEPRGIAVEQESGDVYVSDRENSRVAKFGPEGEFLLAWGWAVADGTSAELQTCTTTCFGGFLPPFAGAGAGQFNHNEGIAVDNDPLSSSHGDVYVIDTSNHRVEKFGPNGEFLLMFGREVNAGTKGDVCTAGETCKAGVAGGGPGQFEGLNGHAIAVGPTGTVYVGDVNRVQLFSGAGAVESTIAIAGAGFIENLAVDSASDIYLTSNKLAGVHKYDGTGTELGSPRDKTGVSERQAISVGPSDELFVNDLRAGRHHVFTYNSSGEQTASFDSAPQSEDAGRRGIAYNEHSEALYLNSLGSVRIVSPPPPGPLVLSGSEKVSGIQPTSATLEATINPEGPSATHYHFEYGTTSAYGKSTSETPLSGGEFEDQPASAAIEGLAPATVYHFRVVAENEAKQITDGVDQTFTTLPPVSVDATSASQVDATSARLEAELNPHGVASEYRFEYGLSTSYGSSAPIPDGSAGAGTTDALVANLVQNLLPGTTYHYRVVAHNALGESLGSDHTFTTQGAAAILADGRAWELVSPPNKHGFPIEPLAEEGGQIQANPAGGGITYVALGPVIANPPPEGVRSPTSSQLVSTRASHAWETQDITTRHEEITIPRAGFPSEYRIFSEDLTSSLVEPEGATRLAPEDPANTERTPYLREADGRFAPLVNADNVPPGTAFGGVLDESNDTFDGGVEFRMATPDLSHALLVSPQLLAPGFKPGFEATSERNLYEYAGGALTLVSILPNGEPASEAGLRIGVGNNDLNMRGAVSDDGSRVFFATVGSERHLYMRDVPLGQTLKLDERQPGAGGGPGAPEFQIASGDGKRVFFTDPSKLTKDSTAQPNKRDLYMCEIEISGGHPSCALSDLSVDPTAGEAAVVEGEVIASDRSGEHVYFAANGVLTDTPNAQGERAVPSKCNGSGEATCNLYAYDTVAHKISLVAVVASADDPDWAGRSNLHGLGNLTARSSPNGRFFTFMSRRSLTGYDNRDARSGAPDEEVFLFDTGNGGLSCVSCDPTGARPTGIFDKESFPGLLVDHPSTWRERWLAASIPGWTLSSITVARYQSRYLSDSGRMFFNAQDALVPQDTNNAEDVYEFEPPGVGDCSASSRTFSSTSGGCVNLISSGSSNEESAFLDASETGDEIFFLTSARLVGSDVDGALDIYDAHACSGTSPCLPPPPPPSTACEGDACQSPSGPPSNPTPSSLTYRGPGNAAPPPAPTSKAAPKPTRAQLLAKALKACKAKKQKQKRKLCERQARKKYGKKKASATRRAGHGGKGTGHR